MTKSHQKAIKAISDSSGRYFGITLKDGSVFNARLLSMSNCFVTMFDRNSKETKKVAKKSITEVRSQGQQFKVYAARGQKK